MRVKRIRRQALSLVKRSHTLNSYTRVGGGGEATAEVAVGGAAAGIESYE